MIQDQDYLEKLKHKLEELNRRLPDAEKNASDNPYNRSLIEKREVLLMTIRELEESIALYWEWCYSNSVWCLEEEEEEEDVGD